MSKSYGQYCPLALAAELLCERWTLLVVSRLIDGCSYFNEIHRGVPRISPTLLSRRLAQLEHAGLVQRDPVGRGRQRRYVLTEAARELGPIIENIAVWGQRWARDMTREDLDPAFLVWSMSTRIDTSRMPATRTVLEFDFSGAPRDCRRFWLVIERGTVDMCLKHPGYEVDVRLSADLRLFIEAWRGLRDLRQEIRAGRIRVEGPTTLRRQLPEWLELSSLAPYPRLRAGRERQLASAVPSRFRRVAEPSAQASDARGPAAPA